MFPRVLWEEPQDTGAASSQAQPLRPEGVRPSWLSRAGAVMGLRCAAPQQCVKLGGAHELTCVPQHTHRRTHTPHHTQTCIAHLTSNTPYLTHMYTYTCMLHHTHICLISQTYLIMHKHALLNLHPTQLISCICIHRHASSHTSMLHTSYHMNTPYHTHILICTYTYTQTLTCLISYHKYTCFLTYKHYT